MKLLRLLFRFVAFTATLLINMLIGLWNLLASLVNVIDGGDDEDTPNKPQHTTHYNHHTGETDRLRYPDGVYSDNRIDRSISDP
jgi:hypothetical protein